MSFTKRLWPYVAFALSLSACGPAAEFGGNADAVPNTSPRLSPSPSVTPADPITPVVPLEPTSAHSLTWNWRCSSAGLTPGEGTDDNPIVEGRGPHRFVPSRLKGTPITIKGELCAPQQMPRYVVFVIDVSGSMGPSADNNDPIINGTCGRLEAVRTLIRNQPDNGMTRYAVTTFSSTMKASSNAFFDTETGVLEAVSGGPANVGATICAADGGTSYTSGMSEAMRLLKLADAQAQREVYFISDGRPEPSDEDGAAEAADLRSRGVSIATIMLGSSSDAVLRTKIASTTNDGKLLHARVEEASDLAKTVGELARNDIAGATMKYRAVGGTPWTEVDITKHMQGYNFALPSITIDIESAPEGLEIAYAYWDKKGYKYSDTGRITWETD